MQLLLKSEAEAANFEANCKVVTTGEIWFNLYQLDDHEIKWDLGEACGLMRVESLPWL